MKLKKILAAVAACAMTTAMLAMTVSAAGADVDEGTLDETPAVTDEITTTPSDDTAETPAPEVSNPTTGNAPIALAVIPVALAAAAVVAKKAK